MFLSAINSYCQRVCFLNLTYTPLMSVDDKNTYTIFIDSDSSTIEFSKANKLKSIVKNRENYRDYFLSLKKDTIHKYIDSITNKMEYISNTKDEKYQELKEDYMFYIRYSDGTKERFLFILLP